MICISSPSSFAVPGWHYQRSLCCVLHSNKLSCDRDSLVSTTFPSGFCSQSLLFLFLEEIKNCFISVCQDLPHFALSCPVFCVLCSSECFAAAVMSSLLMKAPVCPALFGLSQSSLCHPGHAHRERQSLVSSVCASCRAAFVEKNWAMFASHVGDEHFNLLLHLLLIIFNWLPSSLSLSSLCPPKFLFSTVSTKITWTLRWSLPPLSSHPSLNLLWPIRNQPWAPLRHLDSASAALQSGYT